MATLAESLNVALGADVTGLKQGTEQAKRAMKDTGKAAEEMDAKVTKSSRGIVRELNDVKEGFMRVRGIALLAAAAIGVVATPILKSSDALLELEGALKLSGKSLGSTADQAKALANSLGITYATAFDDTKKALGSFAGDAQKALAAVAATTKAASLELFTQQEAMAALAPVAQQYRVSADGIEEAMNLLAAASQGSTIDLQQFSGALVAVARPALQAGVDLKQVATAIVNLNATGATAGEAVEILKQSFQSILAPTEEQRAAAQALGIDYSNAGKAIGGLAPILDTLQSNMFANAEAVQAFLGGNAALVATLQGVTTGGVEPFAASVAKLNAALTGLDYAQFKSTTDKVAAEFALMQNKATDAAIAVQGFWKSLLEGGPANLAFGSGDPDMLFTAGFASGGTVGGSGNGDTVPAMLTPGEFVVRKEVAQAVRPFLQRLNAKGIDPSALNYTLLAGTRVRGESLLDLLGISGSKNVFGIAGGGLTNSGLDTSTRTALLAATSRDILEAVNALKLASGGSVPAFRAPGGAAALAAATGRQPQHFAGGGSVKGATAPMTRNTTIHGGVTLQVTGQRFSDAVVRRQLMPMIERQLDRGQSYRGRTSR